MRTPGRVNVIFYLTRLALTVLPQVLDNFIWRHTTLQSLKRNIKDVDDGNTKEGSNTEQTSKKRNVNTMDKSPEQGTGGSDDKVDAIEGEGDDFC